jgi:hypothetical protein
MTVRRNRNGQVRSIFLSEESTNYCRSVIDVFNYSVGKTRVEMEKELKLMELKSQNPKILRGLALLMFRLSRMERPSHLDPGVVRDAIFRYARSPAVTRDERSVIIDKVASELQTSPSEIDNAMYADNEDNELLREAANINERKLMELYNLEQIETVMIRSDWVELTTHANRARFIRKIRSLGLLYSENHVENGHILRISGPVSILEHSGRYGSRFALLVRHVLRSTDWEINASVKLKNTKGEEYFTYHLDQSVSEYTGDIQVSEPLPDYVTSDPDPIIHGDRTFYPDYSIQAGTRKVNIFLTTPRYFHEDRGDLQVLSAGDENTELLCILDAKGKCPPGARCFRESVNWIALKESLEAKHTGGRKTGTERVAVASGKKMEDQKTTSRKNPDQDVIMHLKNLYPDSQAMVDYLDFMGFAPAETLERAGYRVTWKGLRLIVGEK